MPSDNRAEADECRSEASKVTGRFTRRVHRTFDPHARIAEFNHNRARNQYAGLLLRWLQTIARDAVGDPDRHQLRPRRILPRNKQPFAVSFSPAEHLVGTSCARAIIATEAPGCNVSSTICRHSKADRYRLLLTDLLPGCASSFLFVTIAPQQ